MNALGPPRDYNWKLLVQSRLTVALQGVITQMGDFERGMQKSEGIIGMFRSLSNLKKKEEKGDIHDKKFVVFRT